MALTFVTNLGPGAVENFLVLGCTIPALSSMPKPYTYFPDLLPSEQSLSFR